MIYEYSIQNDTLGQFESSTLASQIRSSAVASFFQHIESSGDLIKISMSQELDSSQVAFLTAVVNAHNGISTSESLKNYLQGSVFPFVTDLLTTFSAENIAMGITQAGKTGHVLSLFGKVYPVPNQTFQNSLKLSFDTGSLYVSLEIIQHVRNNPVEFEGLSPYITDQRLKEMKNKIESFLGLPLSQ
jgi:hypothetical protein